MPMQARAHCPYTYTLPHMPSLTFAHCLHTPTHIPFACPCLFGCLDITPMHTSHPTGRPHTHRTAFTLPPQPICCPPPTFSSNTYMAFLFWFTVLQFPCWVASHTTTRTGQTRYSCRRAAIRPTLWVAWFNALAIQCRTANVCVLRTACLLPLPRGSYIYRLLVLCLVLCLGCRYFT